MICSNYVVRYDITKYPAVCQSIGLDFKHFVFITPLPKQSLKEVDSILWGDNGTLNIEYPKYRNDGFLNLIINWL